MTSGIGAGPTSPRVNECCAARPRGCRSKPQFRRTVCAILPKREAVPAPIEGVLQSVERVSGGRTGVQPDRDQVAGDNEDGGPEECPDGRRQRVAKVSDLSDGINHDCGEQGGKREESKGLHRQAARPRVESHCGVEVAFRHAERHGAHRRNPIATSAGMSPFSPRVSRGGGRSSWSYRCVEGGRRAAMCGVRPVPAALRPEQLHRACSIVSRLDSATVVIPAKRGVAERRAGSHRKTRVPQARTERRAFRATILPLDPGSLRFASRPG